VEVLTEISRDPLPAIQAIALRQLMEIDAELVMPLVDELIDSPDANVRRLVAQSLVRVARKPTVANIAVLGPLLDDRNPTLRRYARDSLIELAELEGFRDAVLEQGRSVLAQESWRGQEQAIRLLVPLNDQTVADRYLELLDSSRFEVHTTAAWGLCELGVPSTIEPIFQVFERKTALYLAYEPQTSGTDVQLAHLAQTIGKFKYEPAEPVLRQYIPKLTALQPVSRAAAIYALGHLYADQNDEALAELLRQRMMDTLSLEPEDPLVRRFCAISLGRMKAEQTLPSLLATLTGAGIREATGISASWAVNQITGEPMPEVTPIIHQDNSWFLVPEKR
jgi:HEAT repeat protein